MSNARVEDLEKNEMVPLRTNRKKYVSKFKETFLEWSKSVDINCYSKMLEYKGNYLVQFIWLLILLSSTGATFFLIAKSIMDYLKYDIVTEIKMVN